MLETLSDVSASKWAVDLFKGSAGTSKAEMNIVRRELANLEREYLFAFEEHEYVGYYHADTTSRVLLGVFPGSYKEFVFMLLYVSMLIFHVPTVETALFWIRNMGRYMWKVDQAVWGVAVDYVDLHVQRSLASKSSS